MSKRKLNTQTDDIAMYNLQFKVEGYTIVVNYTTNEVNITGLIQHGRDLHNKQGGEFKDRQRYGSTFRSPEEKHREPGKRFTKFMEAVAEDPEVDQTIRWDSKNQIALASIYIALEVAGDISTKFRLSMYKELVQNGMAGKRNASKDNFVFASIAVWEYLDDGIRMDWDIDEMVKKWEYRTSMFFNQAVGINSIKDVAKDSKIFQLRQNWYKAITIIVEAGLEPSYEVIKQTLGREYAKMNTLEG